MVYYGARGKRYEAVLIHYCQSWCQGQRRPQVALLDSTQPARWIVGWSVDLLNSIQLHNSLRATEKSRKRSKTIFSVAHRKHFPHSLIVTTTDCCALAYSGFVWDSPRRWVAHWYLLLTAFFYSKLKWLSDPGTSSMHHWNFDWI